MSRGSVDPPPCVAAEPPRFVEALRFSHGALLNVSDVARDCQVQRGTAAGYVGIPEDLLRASRLPAFRRRTHRATTMQLIGRRGRRMVERSQGQGPVAAARLMASARSLPTAGRPGSPRR